MDSWGVRLTWFDCNTKVTQFYLSVVFTNQFHVQSVLPKLK